MPKTSHRYLALLRGINVGGKNIIAKDELKDCFESTGVTNVRTYIQSGNILFRSPLTSVKELTASVEAALSRRFSYEAQAVMLPHRKYKSMINAAPDGWGTNEKEKHNALFTLSCTTPKRVMAQLATPKTHIERVTCGSGVIFWSVSKKDQTKATMMKLAKEPVYQHVTVRNHNTVFKLLELFESV